jgi:hypothetical protein
VLRFVGTEERRSEGLRVESLSTRLRLSVNPIRRRTHGRRVASQLVSERWSPSDEVRIELERSRRFGRQFALVRLSTRRRIEDPWTYVRMLADELSSLLRRVDRVWIDGPSVYMLLPECDRTMVEAMLLRIREPLARVVGEDASPNASLAVFPEDGLTKGALFSALSTDRRTSSPDTKRRSLPTA